MFRINSSTWWLKKEHSCMNPPRRQRPILVAVKTLEPIIFFGHLTRHCAVDQISEVTKVMNRVENWMPVMDTRIL